MIVLQKEVGYTPASSLVSPNTRTHTDKQPTMKGFKCLCVLLKLAILGGRKHFFLLSMNTCSAKEHCKNTVFSFNAGHRKKLRISLHITSIHF